MLGDETTWREDILSRSISKGPRGVGIRVTYVGHQLSSPLKMDR